MPFNPAALENGVLDMIRNTPPSPFQAAQKLANAYAEFVKPAIGAGSPASFTGAEAKVMAAAIAVALKAPGVAPSAINGIISGVTAFWLAPPVTFGAAVTASFAGQAPLFACLMSLSNPKIPEGAAAKKIVGCFDMATRLVFVQPPPPASPVPVG